MMYRKIPNKNILSALYRDDNAYSCKITFQFHFSYVHLSINILRLPCISNTSFFFETHILIMYVNNFHKKARREINSVLIMIFCLCAIEMTYLVHYEQQFFFIQIISDGKFKQCKNFVSKFSIQIYQKQIVS